MMNLKAVKIHNGSGKVAYRMKDDVLEVWLNEQVADAPDDALRTTIIPKATSWMITEVPENFSGGTE